MTSFQIGQLMLVVVFVVITFVFYFQKKKDGHWAYKWMFDLGWFMTMISLWMVISPFILKGHETLSMINLYFLNIVYLSAEILVFRKIIRKHSKKITVSK